MLLSCPESAVWGWEQVYYCVPPHSSGWFPVWGPWGKLSQSHLWGLRDGSAVQSPCACRELELTPGSSALFWLQWVCLHRHTHEVCVGSVESMSKVYCPQKCLVLRNKNVSGFKYGPPCSEKITVFTACSQGLCSHCIIQPEGTVFIYQAC